MITVRVKSIFNLTTVLMEREVKIDLEEGACLRKLLDALEVRFGSKLSQILYEDDCRELSSELIFILNGRNIMFLDGVETLLADGDELFLYPRISGS